MIIQESEFWRDLWKHVDANRSSNIPTLDDLEKKFPKACADPSDGDAFESGGNGPE